MKPRILVLITAMTVLAALAVPDRLRVRGQSQPQLQYTVTDLGTLGGTFSWAEGINDKGWVDGFSSLPGDVDQHAFLWREGVLTDLGTLGGPNSGLGFWGEKPNEQGEIAGTAQASTTDPFGEDFCLIFNNFSTEPPGQLTCLPFVWQSGVITPLPTLGGNNGSANQINNRGQVAGAAENGTPPDANCVGAPRPKPVLWGKSMVQELPTFPGDPYGVVDAINDNGQATGLSVNSCMPSVAHALLWQNGVATYLGNLGGNFFDEGVDVNNQGQVVGLSSLPGDLTNDAFLWTEDHGMQDLGTLPGDFGSFAVGINSKSQVVGTSFDASGNFRAFLWQNGVMTDLNTLTAAGSSLFLLAASKINSRGQIVGLAFDTNTGELHAYLATPSKDEVATGSAAAAAQGGNSQRPKVVLPKNVRKLLRQRLGHRYRIILAPVGPTD